MVASDYGIVTVMGSLPTGSTNFTAPSSSGLGHLVFNQGTSVRIRLGLLLVGAVAQLVERRIEDPRVGGSIPPGPTNLRKHSMELTERRLAANRRNIELGREKARTTWQRKKAHNNQKVEHTFTCAKCGNLFIKAIRNIDFENGRFPIHCSRSCANSRTRTPELRERVSQKLRLTSFTNGEKTVIQPRFCKNCGKQIHHKSRHRNYCSDECRIAFRKAERATKYDAEYAKYRVACKFRFNLADYPDEFDFELIRQHGWYSPSNKKNNPNGVSRDHMYSVKAGYLNKVPSTIIEHPANCQLILHRANESKGSGCSITLEELKSRIASWENKYGPYQNGIWANQNQ